MVARSPMNLSRNFVSTCVCKVTFKHLPPIPQSYAKFQNTNTHFEKHSCSHVQSLIIVSQSVTVPTSDIYSKKLLWSNQKPSYILSSYTIIMNICLFYYILYIFFIEINVENINITYTGVEGVTGFSLREDVKINYIFEPDHLKLEWPVCLQWAQTPLRATMDILPNQHL